MRKANAQIENSFSTTLKSSVVSNKTTGWPNKKQAKFEMPPFQKLLFVFDHFFQQMISIALGCFAGEMKAIKLVVLELKWFFYHLVRNRVNSLCIIRKHAKTSAIVFLPTFVTGIIFLQYRNFPIHYLSNEGSLDINWVSVWIL